MVLDVVLAGTRLSAAAMRRTVSGERSEFGAGMSA